MRTHARGVRSTSDVDAGAYADDVSQGAVHINLTIPNGSVVKSGALLCVDVLDFDGGGALTDPNVMVHGFFAKDN